MRALSILLVLPAAAAALPGALPAQSNATSTLITYGDILNGSCTAALSGATPNTVAYILPALTNTGSNYLVGLSGDPNDLLAVGLDLASGGTYFQGMTNAQGKYSVNFTLGAAANFLDRKVYFQGFTQTAGPSFQDFSNLRILTLNNANRWQPSVTDMPAASANLAFCASRFGPNGRATEIFICGGGPAMVTSPTTPYNCTDKAWVYDMLREQHTLRNGRMHVSRAFHNVVRLGDGRILAVGGVTFGGQSGTDYYTNVLKSCEVYDPVTDSWTLTPDMAYYRAGATANLLPDGRVLVAGGTEGNASHQLFDSSDLLSTSLKFTEIYNPATNTWSAGPNLPEPKAGAESVALNDGKILIAGGITYNVIFGIPFPDFSQNASIYNPTNNSFSSVNMQVKRALFGISKMNDGRVLCAGGAGGNILTIGPIKQAEIYDPGTNAFTQIVNLPADAAFPIAVTLTDGRPAVLGGAQGTLDDPVPTAACYAYNTGSNTWTTLDPMDLTHGGGAGAVLEDGTVYYGGGESNNGSATDQAESYTP